MPHKRKGLRKNAEDTFTFRLVHRSQRDPRIADPQASPYVLVPVLSRKDKKRQDVAEAHVEDVELEFEDVIDALNNKKQLTTAKSMTATKTAATADATTTTTTDYHGDEVDEIDEDVGQVRVA